MALHIQLSPVRCASQSPSIHPPPSWRLMSFWSCFQPAGYLRHSCCRQARGCLVFHRPTLASSFRSVPWATLPELCWASLQCPGIPKTKCRWVFYAAPIQRQSMPMHSTFACRRIPSRRLQDGCELRDGYSRTYPRGTREVLCRHRC